MLMQRLIRTTFTLALFSCGVESTEIGSDFFNGGSLGISYIDTASVKLSTIRFDSIVTSSANRIMIGSYEDHQLGRTTTAMFMEISIPSGTLDDDNNNQIDYDSITLTLKYDDYFYNDTTKLLTLNVHRLTEEISGDDYGYLYNSSSFSYDKDILGSLSFRPKPHRDDSVEIRLDDALGEELFQKMLTNDEDLSSQTEFVEYFQGLFVLPDTATAACIIGFAKSPELRLYFRDKSVVPSQQKHITFPATSGKIFNWIHSNRTSTALVNLKNSRSRVSAADTNDEAYIQAGVGLALRVDMPYLRSLNQLENFYVSKAILDLYPVQKSYPETLPLPAELKVYTHDRRNDIYGTFETGAPLIEDTDLQRDTRYQFDVTSFVKDQMALEEFNEHALVFVLSDEEYRSSVNRLYMASPDHGYKTKLTIYFASLNY